MDGGWGRGEAGDPGQRDCLINPTMSHLTTVVSLGSVAERGSIV